MLGLKILSSQNTGGKYLLGLKILSPQNTGGKFLLGLKILSPGNIGENYLGYKYLIPIISEEYHWDLNLLGSKMLVSKMGFKILNPYRAYFMSNMSWMIP
jgi:hypothetical protein